MKNLKTFETFSSQSQEEKLSPAEIERCHMLIKDAKEKIKRQGFGAASDIEKDLIDDLESLGFDWRNDPEAKKVLGHYLDMN